MAEAGPANDQVPGEKKSLGKKVKRLGLLRVKGDKSEGKDPEKGGPESVFPASWHCKLENIKGMQGCSRGHGAVGPGLRIAVRPRLGREAHFCTDANVPSDSNSS